MILYHDDDLKRLAGIDRPIRDLTLEEVQNVKLNNRPNYHTYDYTIAMPVEYIRICKHYNKVPVIDIKWGMTFDKIDELINILKEEDMYDKSIIICYTMKCVYISIKLRRNLICLKWKLGIKIKSWSTLLTTSMLQS